MKGTIAWSYVVIWAVVAIGAAYFGGMNLMRWSTNTSSGRVLTIVMGLVCIAAVIRLGNALGWWRLLYRPRH
ncbi:hypothetical protein [Sulfobacillus harzensis]|uniref:Uncharacterized protein n=1 Tax=Sulfobacillus harzensis TaxID=2729629 RepID=A0A7Y0L9Y7_9FIRM|nr:hypothetical protein [Sulfobacillus harzensis]NMP24594.1 hypothetical protein [Sulfobacillus harzensis]